jgi:hypothetical protein
VVTSVDWERPGPGFVHRFLNGVQLSPVALGSEVFADDGLAHQIGSRIPHELLAGVALLSISPLFPWFRLFAGGDGGTYGGLAGEFWTIALLVWAASMVIIVAVFILKSDRGVQVAQVAGITVLLVTLCLVGGCELLAALVPSFFLPESVRDALLDVKGSYGLWMALAGSALILVGLSGRSLLGYLDRFQLAFEPSRRRQAVQLLILYLGAVALLGWLRYMPWLTFTASDEFTVHLSAWAAPWIGSLSLLAIALLIAAAVAWLLGRLDLAVALAGLGGWAFTFLAASVVLAGTAFALLPFDDLTLSELAARTPITIPDDVASAEAMSSTIEVQVTWGAWMAYALGVACAGLSIWATMLRSGARKVVGW